MSLLPNHKSKFDKKIDEFIGLRLEGLDLGAIDTLASSCPESLLPILAASFDVDIDGLSQSEARELIKNAFEIHYYSGTFYSLNKALKSLYSDVRVKEWFDYSGLPYHFKLELDASKNGLSPQILKRSDELINKYKNQQITNFAKSTSLYSLYLWQSFFCIHQFANLLITKLSLSLPSLIHQNK